MLIVYKHTSFGQLIINKRLRLIYISNLIRKFRFKSADYEPYTITVGSFSAIERS